MEDIEKFKFGNLQNKAEEPCCLKDVIEKLSYTNYHIQRSRIVSSLEYVVYEVDDNKFGNPKMIAYITINNKDIEMSLEDFKLKFNKYMRLYKFEQLDI